MVLRRELSGKAADEKSVAVGIGVGYQEDPRWAKSTPSVRGWGGGGGWILKNHTNCTVSVRQTIYCKLKHLHLRLAKKSTPPVRGEF